MGDHDDDLALVGELAERAKDLARALPRGVRRLVLRAGTHAVEVDWEIAPASAAAPATATGPAAESESAEGGEPPGHVIPAPLVGTFYRSPEPGADPFVEEGGPVDAGQDVCIVEAMKFMNRVQSDVSGIVRAILVEDGEMVEFGQPLVVIDVEG